MCISCQICSSICWLGAPACHYLLYTGSCDAFNINRDPPTLRLSISSQQAVMQNFQGTPSTSHPPPCLSQRSICWLTTPAPVPLSFSGLACEFTHVTVCRRVPPPGRTWRQALRGVVIWRWGTAVHIQGQGHWSQLIADWSWECHLPCT